MHRARRRAVVVGAATAMTAIATLAGTAGAALAPPITNVPTANTKVAGMTRPDKLSPELTKHAVATGNMALENPSGANTFYGYDGTNPMVPLPGTTLEAQKTEPDKNTYLVLRGQKGADPNYDYGTHFLFQGHETGSPGYITRINLDADVEHRVTLLANSDTAGQPLPVFDGSTWDPFAQRLLFTAELGNAGGVWQATLDRAVQGAGRERLPRPGRLRGHSERRARQPLHRRGRRWRDGGRQVQGPQQLPVPVRAEEQDRPDAGRQAAGAAVEGPAGRLVRRQHVLAGHEGPAHLRQDVRHFLGHHPRHRGQRHDTVRRQRAGEGGRRHAVQATRERDVPPGLVVPRVLLRRDR